MRIWLIDHHDSFTLNIREWLLVHPAVLQVSVVAYDDPLGMADVGASSDPIVLGPGPKDPGATKETRNLVTSTDLSRPILGICLGHQLLAAIAGAPIVRARKPIHGVAVSLEGDADLCGGRVAIYNSLVVGHDPDGYRVTARNADREIMAIAAIDSHAKRWGWQFHPESFLTTNGHELCKLFVEECIAATHSFTDEQLHHRQTAEPTPDQRP